MNDFQRMRTASMFETTRACSLIAVLGVLSLITMAPLNAFGNETKINWELTDIEGKLHKPLEDPSTTGIVLVFVSTDCQIANSYQPLLRRLHEEYTAKGIRLFQVHPHTKTSVEKARQHAAEYKIQSPILIDADQSLSRSVGATVTPEVIVFRRDQNASIYQGRIDDLYARYGKKRKVATTNDLVDVLDRLVSQQPITPRKTKPIGCFIALEETNATGPPATDRAEP